MMPVIYAIALRSYSSTNPCRWRGLIVLYSRLLYIPMKREATEPEILNSQVKSVRFLFKGSRELPKLFCNIWVLDRLRDGLHHHAAWLPRPPSLCSPPSPLS